MKGNVILVGAGPGDPGLLTQKGRQALEQAQVVVFDRLVSPAILALIPPQAEAIDVGKESSHHLVPQDQINRILLEKALEGKRVVRLKGGDPFLFGRGGEELELLTEYGIPYEVVPGVTSSIAVPAYNGIPVTHRDYCSSVHIITGHKKAGQEYDIDFEALVRTGGTLVFLMGVTALEDICTHLVAAGMDPATPAAILQQGTTAGQKKIVATVGTLKAEVDRRGIQTPAIIVVGGVCELADRFGWYEALPLAGCKVLITRPRELISSMAAKLRAQGAEVVEFPAISVRPVADRTRIHESLRRLDTYQWIAFTSPSGVGIFFELLTEAGKDIRALGSCKIAAIGKGTRKALQEHNLYPDLMPETFDGEALGRKMAQECEAGARILIPRASIGNKEILEQLGKRPDLVVEDLSTYDTVYETQNLIDIAGEFEKGSIRYAVFTSASTVRGFVQAAGSLDFTRVNALCIGRQTQQEAAKHGMTTYVSKEASIDSLLHLVVELYQREKQGDEHHGND